MNSNDLKGVKVNFNLRSKTGQERELDQKTKSKSNKETSINCVVRWNNQKIVLTAAESINPLYFDKESQRAKDVRAFTGRAAFNTRLDLKESNIKEVYRNFLTNQNRYPLPNELKELIKHKFAGTQPTQVETITLFRFIEDFIKFADQRLSTQTKQKLTSTTKRVYGQVFTVLKEFNIIWKQNLKKTNTPKGNQDLDFDDIDLQFYTDYTKYLNEIKKYKVNTVGKHIKTLKTFLNDAASKGLTTNQIFKHRDFIGGTEEVSNIYLNNDELNKIAKLDLANNFKLDRVRDLFLIGCYTGLRFSDFITIPKECINIEEKLIVITTQKTNKEVVIPIHKTVLAILKKYKDKTENSLPPALSNAKMNEYLKDVAKLAELNEVFTKTQMIAGKSVNKQFKQYELVCTHTARRSFATNSYKMGIPIYAIMAITGHTREQTFKNYIKVTSTEHANIIAGYWHRQEMAAI